jgi:MoaA/NifB/PqqE/SkfB family radical SAM enzyme
MNRLGAWPRKATAFWDELLDNAKDIKYLEITGGEPFMIREHFEFLEKLVELGYSSDIEIHYNTNGTIYPEQAGIWEQFKHVEIAFSIDDISDRFEYQRHGANWNSVVSNISQFKQLKKNNNNISLQVCVTSNIFNVYYLEELAKWIECQNRGNAFDFVYWNILHDAEVHCITSLPKSLKGIVAERLLNAEVNDVFKSEFKNIVDFMMTDSKIPSEDILFDIKRMDDRKGGKFSDSHSEVAVLLGLS